MTVADDKAFWSTQTSSRHRSSDADFYRRKAREHAAMLTPTERSAGSLDLGCGAGELLFHLSDRVKVDTGIDYSQSMLDQAEKLLEGRNIALLNVDIFDYLPNATEPIWMTTGAINQYLNKPEMHAFLQTFARNEKARALFLFDCVDPIRHKLTSLGISYLRWPDNPPGTLKGLLRPAIRFYRLVRFSADVAFGRYVDTANKLSGEGMGYGYLPSFWNKTAELLNLDIDIVSSQLYEYRYHVALRKRSA